jgi:exonuclease SbcC
MKLKKLIVQGFGPFRSAQIVDFAALGANGLFMISGPTGSGKTAILDAICFALYGETTSEGQAEGTADGRSGDELRCSRCQPADKTEVELEFSAGDSTYRIMRNPAYIRSAKRGVGETPQSANASIWKQSQADPAKWDAVETRRISEVDEKVQEITGLTVDQFRRVIILPQGRFRDVLIADYGTREDMLKRIFGTEVYERFETVIAEKFKVVKNLCDTNKNKLESVVQTQPWAGDIDRSGVNDIVDARAKDSEDALALARATRSTVEATLATKNQALGEAIQVNAIAKSAQEAATELEQAQRCSVEANPKRTELTNARNAQTPIEKLTTSNQFAQQLSEKNAEHHAVASADHSARTHLAACDALRAIALAAHAQGAPMRERMGAINAALEEIERKKEVHIAATGQLNGAQIKATAALEAYEKCAAGFKAGEAKCDILDGQLREASQKFAQGIAARLAQDLQPQLPCAVCGSLDHPAPAQPSSDAVEQEIVDQAQEDLDKQRGVIQKLQDQLATAATERDRTATERDEKRIAFTNTLTIADDAQLKMEQEALSENLKAREDAYAQACSNRDSASDSSKAAHTKFEQLQMDIARLKNEVEAADVIYRQAMAASGFTSKEDLNAASRSKDIIEQIDQELKVIDRKLTEATAKHKTLQTQLDCRVETDVTALKNDVSKLGEQRSKADNDILLQTTESQKLRTFGAEFAAALTALTKSEADFRTVALLNEIVIGKTGDARLSLHAWVLGAVLDRILVQASEIMRPLSHGRYELVRGEGAQDKRTAAGLDIEVLDNNTGTRRAARTLSGGETFLASLSLALALAEVAQAYHGARPLDTVFIDEGFGALDSDALDTAMKALTALRDKGRIVGIISHVEEVKRQIPCQLQVTRDPVTNESSVLARG